MWKRDLLTDSCAPAAGTKGLLCFGRWRCTGPVAKGSDQHTWLALPAVCLALSLHPHALTAHTTGPEANCPEATR